MRYALGPAASKVELIDLDDRRSGLAPRRAAFMWTDIVRGDEVVGHQIQKVTAGGATDVPLDLEFEVV